MVPGITRPQAHVIWFWGNDATDYIIGEQSEPTLTSRHCHTYSCNTLVITQLKFLDCVCSVHVTPRLLAKCVEFVLGIVSN